MTLHPTVRASIATELAKIVTAAADTDLSLIAIITHLKDQTADSPLRQILREARGRVESASTVAYAAVRCLADDHYADMVEMLKPNTGTLHIFLQEACDFITVNTRFSAAEINPDKFELYGYSFVTAEARINEAKQILNGSVSKLLPDTTKETE